jgi:hypothetical protein
VYYNNGGGFSFTFATETATTETSVRVEIADINGDGTPDIVEILDSPTAPTQPLQYMLGGTTWASPIPVSGTVAPRDLALGSIR